MKKNIFSSKSQEMESEVILKEYIKKKPDTPSELTPIQKDTTKSGSFMNNEKKKLEDLKLTKSTVKKLEELETIFMFLKNKDISIDNFVMNNGILILNETILSTNLLKTR